MAHERGDVTTVGVYSGGRDASAAELQRLLRARRESITQTVEEIKMTMNSGYQDTKQQVSQTFDWRYQMRQHPLSAVAGAVAIGFLAGQVLGRTMSHSSTRGISRGGGTSGTRSRILTSSSFGAGTSMSPESRSHFESSGRSSERHEHREPRHIIPPAVKSRVGGRFEETISDMAENLLSELSRVGREVLIPTIVARLTSTITHEGSTSQSGGQQRRSYSPKSTTESASGTAGSSGIQGTAAGGPINQSGEDQGRNRFQGRGI